jgi:hypothetical protein
MRRMLKPRSCGQRTGRCGVNTAHVRQSRPDAGRGFTVRILKTFYVVPSSLGSRSESTDARRIHAPVGLARVTKSYAPHAPIQLGNELKMGWFCLRYCRRRPWSSCRTLLTGSRGQRMKLGSKERDRWAVVVFEIPLERAFSLGLGVHGDTSRIRNSASLGPCSRTMSRA